MIQALGVYDKKGTLQADSIQRAKPASVERPVDH
jgi:hypothetical protein